MVVTTVAAIQAKHKGKIISAITSAVVTAIVAI